MKMIAEYEFYLDKSIDFIICDIVEYDMKSAGFSIIQEYKLLPDNVITALKNIPTKFELNKAIGKIDRKQKGLLKEVREYIKEYRIRFCEENNVDDDHILSIKRDAMFIKKYCKVLEFPNEATGETHIRFVPKARYTAYLYLDKKELYYSHSGIDVKGIGDNVLTHHEDYMLKFIHQMITILCNYDYDLFKRKLVDFANKYKRRELPIGYYREFNDLSQYKVYLDGNIMLMNDLGDVSVCDISYNYNNIIIPLLGLVM